MAFKDAGVAVIAPSGYAPDQTVYERGIGKLRALGCRVVDYYEPQAKSERFGASDTARLRQLQEATDNPDVQIVLAVRGGYGISRLLPQLDFARMAASGKLFVGHSDFTPIHLGLLGAGATSFAGPFILPDFAADPVSDFTMEQFAHCLTSPEHSVSGQAEGNPAVDVEGVLWGGNLAMIAHLLGSPYQPQIENGILFLEDVAEHPYRIERMLLQLLHAGILQKQKAVVLGDFSGYRLTDYDNGYGFESMLAFIRSRLDMPVLAGLPFGHIAHKATLAVGAHARLQGRDGEWQLSMRNYRYIGA
ncbi:MAG TPA: muramoyltetrapeptide carboxypeptidase [Burkholderiaceae bacterium]